MEPIQTCFERHETKYLITPSQYQALKQGMVGRMAPDLYPRYTICNLYYDTPSFQLIRDSLEHPTYKEKLRLRSYGLVDDERTVFLEMKKKLNGLVFKRRICLPAREAMAYLEQDVRPTDDNQICKEIDWMRRCYDLDPVVFIGYEREAWSGIEDPALRVTFDTDIRWRTEALDLRLRDDGQALDLEGRILLEVKFPGAAPFWLGRLLNELGIRRTSFSKYGAVYRQALLYRPQAPAIARVEAEARSGLLRRHVKTAALAAANL